MINMNSVSGSHGLSVYGVNEEDVEAATNSKGANFLYNISVLKEKVHQVESLATMFIGKCSDQSTGEVIGSNMGTLIQEIIVTASSLMFTCQHISPGPQATPSPLTNTHHHDRPVLHQEHGGDHQPVLHQEHGGNHQPVVWYGDSYINRNMNNDDGRGDLSAREVEHSKNTCDILELNAADLLAKYTHHCQVCGKGFKRDANLRMHMRAHGDEYKSRAALTNPLKKNGDDHNLGEKYSCPEEGCRYNKKHPKFQPLKSMICAKNHYKRCHCPKMYVCKRCNGKRFSVLSDLRTHEKHCGDVKWMCSCGNSFSRKDKLLGHVALFVGHSPAPTSLVEM